MGPSRTLADYEPQTRRSHPAYGHRRGAGHVTKDNRRFHTAGAIALHPAKAGKRKTVELLAKVLHHIVTFGFAVHQYVQAKRFLAFHRVGDLFAHPRFVVRLA